MDHTRSDSAKKRSIQRRWDRFIKMLRSEIDAERRESARLEWIEVDRINRNIRREDIDGSTIF